ncbi:MAG: Smr/MutS family protein [Clostridiaceae bacterium]|nr:Smr/MutS family protein [Clostridiaceae bacterium]
MASDPTCLEINLEEGMPTVEQAIKRLTFYLRTKKGSGVRTLKLIHGYGSSGTGGKIRIECRKYLESQQRRGEIKYFVPGEEFSIFDPQTQKLLIACPGLRRDHDLERRNNGITIVLL